MKTFKWTDKNNCSCIIYEKNDKQFLNNYQDKFEPIIKFVFIMDKMYIKLKDKISRDVIMFKYI